MKKNSTVDELLSVNNKEIEIREYPYENGIGDSKDPYPIRDNSEYTVEDLIDALKKLNKNSKVVISTTEFPAQTIKLEVSKKFNTVILYPY